MRWVPRHLYKQAFGTNRAFGKTFRMGVSIQGKFMRHRSLNLPRIHSDNAQATEITIAAQVLDRMLDFRCPNSVRVT